MRKKLALLTRSEAKKQLDTYTRNLIYTSFSLNRSVNKIDIPENIKALKEAGFIELRNSIPGNTGTLEIMLIKKGSPYLANAENNELHFNVGRVTVRVNSVTKHFTGTTGIEEYDVNYTYTIVHNAFFKVWNPHCFKEGSYTDNVVIRKSDNGWTVGQN